MENNAGGKKGALSPQEEIAKAAILAECDKLAKAGVTFVAVHFDGYGDDGATAEVKCFASEYYAYAEQEAVDHDVSLLQEHFETLVPFGYENDCCGLGGGIVCENSRKRAVAAARRFAEYATSTYQG